MNNKLNILWTNADPITAKHMVFMYGPAAKTNGWWEEITIIIWGATVKLAAENKDVKEAIKEAKEHGIHVSACLSCANELGVTGAIREQDVELIYWGEPLTEIIKNGEKLITI